MLGTAIGDISGQMFEGDRYKAKYDTELFPPGCHLTDDTTMACATMAKLLGRFDRYADAFRFFYKIQPRGYGKMFHTWANDIEKGPYGSWANGSAMRVGPVGWAFNTMEETILEAEKSAEVTHNHIEGITGAQAVAAAIFLARKKAGKSVILETITSMFGYKFNFELDDLIKNYEFDITCSGTVPPALFAFSISTSFEDSIRIARSIGGDADTLTAINGSVAEAYYGIPNDLQQQIKRKIIPEFLDVIDEFYNKFVNKNINYHP